MEKIRFIDLFCGIGGFRVAMDQACIENHLNRSTHFLYPKVV
jgi:DNA (cytosine-5)-methyltransferase 1